MYRVVLAETSVPDIGIDIEDDAQQDSAADDERDEEVLEVPRVNDSVR